MALSVQTIVDTTREITSHWKTQRGGLIPILQQVQEALGYLPPEAMETIYTELKIPKAEVYGVATFYAQFHLKPRGRNIIRVCRGTACHVRGSARIMTTVKDLLGIQENCTTDDLRFTLEPVACLGACGLAPVIMVNKQTFGAMEPGKLVKILDMFQ